jgi:hypothetical protein
MFGSSINFNIKGEDTVKTGIGCLFTSLVLILVLASFGWYFLQFLDKTNVEVNTTQIIETKYPRIDFKSDDFFYSVVAVRDNEIVSKAVIDTMVKFEAQQYMISSKETNGIRGDFKIEPPTLIEMSPCKAGGKTDKVKGSQLEGNYKLALSDFSTCTFPDNPNIPSPVSEMFTEGNEDSDSFSYVRIKIGPCDRTDINCLFYFTNLMFGMAGTEAYSRLAHPTAVAIHGDTTNFVTPGGDCQSGAM